MIDYHQYYSEVHRKLLEVKKIYPFIKVIYIPTMEPRPVEIKVIAVNQDIISVTGAHEEDFCHQYSRELQVVIPFDYASQGCLVYGGAWIDTKKMKSQFQHFNGKKGDDYLFCVGVPDSFSKYDNVILENIKTADMMLTAYEEYQSGRNKELELIAYSHGDRGINEYNKEQKNKK